MPRLLRRHRAFMKQYRGHRRQLKTPCCGKRLTVPAPRDPAEQWDSLATCPYCAELFMKVVNHKAAVGRVPGATA